MILDPLQRTPSENKPDSYRVQDVVRLFYTLPPSQHHCGLHIGHGSEINMLNGRLIDLVVNAIRLLN